MKMLVICGAVLAATAAPVAAEIRYDRKLEQAVMEIVAKKMGDLRGGFSHDVKPVMVTVQDRMITGSIGIETARLTTEVDRPDALMCKASRIITF